jgi:predicted transcriptional regulator of viral defense system
MSAELLMLSKIQRSYYTTMVRSKGISESNRNRLAMLHRSLSGPFNAADAAPLLSMDIQETRLFLAYLASRGWLSHVRRGLYLTVPLEATKPNDWREDPWLVAAKAFAPCYIGGWSACEHWGLTEQIFREVLVVSSRRVRYRRVEIQGIPFRVKVLPQRKLFGTRTVWRKQVRLQVSDPSRTIVDVLDDPALGGGIRHVAEVLSAYLSSEHRDEARVLEYADQLGNRAVFKRLGYIVETLGVSAPKLVETCKAKQSSGLSLLDPTVPSKGRILRRWNLRVNAHVSPSEDGIP